MSCFRRLRRGRTQRLTGSRPSQATTWLEFLGSQVSPDPPTAFNLCFGCERGMATDCWSPGPGGQAESPLAGNCLRRTGGSYPAGARWFESGPFSEGCGLRQRPDGHRDDCDKTIGLNEKSRHAVGAKPRCRAYLSRTVGGVIRRTHDLLDVPAEDLAALGRAAHEWARNRISHREAIRHILLSTVYPDIERPPSDPWDRLPGPWISKGLAKAR